MERKKKHTEPDREKSLCSAMPDEKVENFSRQVNQCVPQKDEITPVFPKLLSPLGYKRIWRDAENKSDVE